MKLKAWLKKIGQKIKNFFKGVDSVLDKLDETGKVVVPIAVNVVEVLKNLMASPVSDVIAGIVSAAIPGTADDAIIRKTKEWLEKELPRIAIKLKLVDTAINLTTPEKKLKAICEALNVKGTGKDALEFAASLSGYLSDGKLSGDEIKQIISEYYDKFVKK